MAHKQQPQLSANLYSQAVSGFDHQRQWSRQAGSPAFPRRDSCPWLCSCAEPCCLICVLPASTQTAEKKNKKFKVLSGRRSEASHLCHDVVCFLPPCSVSFYLRPLSRRVSVRLFPRFCASFRQKKTHSGQDAASSVSSARDSHHFDGTEACHGLLGPACVSVHFLSMHLPTRTKCVMCVSESSSASRAWAVQPPCAVPCQWSPTGTRLCS